MPVNGPILEIVIILLLLVLNGVFAMSEIAVISARKLRLRQMADRGDKGAATAIELASHPARFLSTVQIGITLIGIMAGAFGGATLAEEIAERLETIPLLAPYNEAIGVIIVVVAITYFSLVIGELVPKSLALQRAETIAILVAPAMRALSRAASPVVRVLSYSTDTIIRLLGVKPSSEPAVTEEDVRLLIAQGTQAGIFEQAEQEMVEGVFRLGERRINTLMTPRTDIVWLDIEDDAGTIRGKIESSGLSSLAVAKDNLDNILGVAHTKDMIVRCMAGEPVDLRTLVQPPLFLPENTIAQAALDAFKSSGSGIAFVVDEYGGVEGMITPIDLLESIAGEMTLPGVKGEPAIVQREDGSWLLDAMLPVDQLKELLGVEHLPDEESDRYVTAGGFVISQMGRIPSVGQHFDWGAFRIEVVDMDGRRVDKVLVKPTSPGSPDPDPD